jgi:IS30 family transposase
MPPYARAWPRSGRPARIAGNLKRRHPDEPRRWVSAPTIYAWIERDEHRDHWKSLGTDRRLVRRRDPRYRGGAHRPCRRKNPTLCAAARIKDRPAVIEQRLRLGDERGRHVPGTARHRRPGHAGPPPLAVHDRHENPIQGR